MSYFVHSIKPYDVFLMIIFAALLVGAALFAQSFRKKQYDLIGMRKYFFAVSGILLLISILSLVYNNTGGRKLNYSLEFTGGTIIEMGFEKSDISSDEIKNAIEKYSASIKNASEKLKTPVVQMEGTAKQITYPEKYNSILLTMKKKDGSIIKNSEISGILTPFIDNYGSVIMLDEKIPESEQVDLRLGIAKVVKENEVKPEENKENKQKNSVDITPDEKDKIGKLLSFFDKNLEVVSIVKGPDVTVPVKTKEFKSAIVRLSKEDLTNLSADDVLLLITQLSKDFGNIYKFKVESIGPTIGGELRGKALLAIFIALGLQLIYITLRFGNQVRFGIAADIALLHDLVIMVGIYSIVGREIDSPFLAALLTVIGYSVMDSIVIFDRIRENLKLLKKETYEQAVNISVNQTMSRSVNTLLTVLLTLFALYFFGGATLKNFAFALLIGCTTGAYSSIFIASPLLVIIDEWVKKKESERVANRRAELAAAAQAKSEKSKTEKQKEESARKSDDGGASQKKSEASDDSKKPTPRKSSSTRQRTKKRLNKASKPVNNQQ